MTDYSPRYRSRRQKLLKTISKMAASIYLLWKVYAEISAEN
jgi:hypothetical protein